MIGLALGSEHRRYKGPYAATGTPQRHQPVRHQRAKNRTLALKVSAITALMVILLSGVSLV